MAFHRIALACSLLLSAVIADSQNVNLQDMDRSIKPGDDFYRYANGGWLRAALIPEGQSVYDNRAVLVEKTSRRVRGLIEDAAAARAAQGSATQKVGDYYAAFLDEGGIEAKGLTPLEREFAAISAIRNPTALSAYLGSTLNSEVEGLTGNADHILGVWVNQGFEDSRHNVCHLWQGGLGMPDRETYLDSSTKSTELRQQYQAHIAAILKLAGVTEAEARSARIVSLEIRMAQSHAPDSDAADVFKQDNLWKRSDFITKAPGIDWDRYFKAAGLDGESQFIVWQPSAVTGIAALVQSQDIETWKDYLRFHLVEHYASVLPGTVRTEDFAFYGKTLTGAAATPGRAALAIAATNGALGQAVGQLYTQKYFSPHSKAKAQEMVANIVTAYGSRISNLSWMSPLTREKALSKLAALKVGVGYPDTWIDYAALEVKRGDAFGNMQRAEAFHRSRNLAKLRQPPNPAEWTIDPQIVGAIIMFSPNAEFFSAGILQPPYFDGEGDGASNYGSAGAGLAHEITHSFDELGNIYDAEGRLDRWWTGEDVATYRVTAEKLVRQFSRYCPLPELCVNGKQVLGESSADLAGLMVAHDAYILSLHGKPDVVIDGLTGEQRFFVAFAQRWRRAQSETALRRQVATDSHSPGQYRSDTVRNVESWYKAFSVSPADKLYLKPEDRVAIW